MGNPAKNATVLCEVCGSSTAVRIHPERKPPRYCSKKCWGVASESTIVAGARYGRLTVVGSTGRRSSSRSQILHLRCSCGNDAYVPLDRLTSGRTRSCGCLNREQARQLGLRAASHGETRGGHQSARYRMWHDAKRRAARGDLPFDLRLEDLEIPEKCPVLGIPLNNGRGAITKNSPTLDRMVPSLGYVRGNVSVISASANSTKGRYDAEHHRRRPSREHQLVADWMERPY